MALDIKQAFMDYVNSDGSIPFDLYAQDIEDWKFLQELIPGIVITSAGGVGLFQAEGLIEDYPFYFRSETGSSSICIAEPNGTPHLFTGEVLWYGRCDTDPELFRMNDVEFVRELLKCMKNLEKAPFLWTFMGRKLIFKDRNNLKAGWSTGEELEESHGYGHTAEEGYAKAAEPFTDERYLAIAPLELQQAMWRDKQVSPIPLVGDKRLWPTEKPAFLELSERL